MSIKRLNLNTIKNKIQNPELITTGPSPPSGFILQKDVYTTNLLYANNQFPLTSFKNDLKFRRQSGRKPDNPTRSIKILKQNGSISSNSDSDNVFYYFSPFKPKKFKNQKLKFPLPKINILPLSKLILQKEICQKNVKIKNMEDDLNITSKYGKKIFYNLRETFFSTLPLFQGKRSFESPTQKFKSKKFHQKNQKFYSFTKSYKRPKIEFKDFLLYCQKKNFLFVHKTIYQINGELKSLYSEEKEKKKAFFKSKIFTTQLNTDMNKGIRNCFSDSDIIHQSKKSL